MTTITTTMTRQGQVTEFALQPSAFALLAAWTSPACPIGAFSYSHGLETLEADGRLGNALEAERAIVAALTEGAGRSDAVLLAAAYRAVGNNEDALAAVNAKALSLAPAAERYGETARQGMAFAKLVDAVWPLPDQRALCDTDPIAFPVAFGCAAAAHGVPLPAALYAFVLASGANLVSAAVRLVPLGQTDGQRITDKLAPIAWGVAHDAVNADPGDLGSASIALDIAAMRHEDQRVRLFRS